jgi:hypothetical protein
MPDPRKAGRHAKPTPHVKSGPQVAPDLRVKKCVESATDVKAQVARPISGDR